MDLTLGIDLACRAAHQASLARPDGTFVWSGRKFFTRPAELEKLWKEIGLGDQDTLRVVMEPTRNTWAPVASWFRHRGARILLEDHGSCQRMMRCPYHSWSYGLDGALPLSPFEIALIEILADTARPDPFWGAQSVLYRRFSRFDSLHEIS